jgi:hypothetical protein
LEKTAFVDQKRRQALQFLADHAAVFCRQGSVQPSWRWYQRKKLGPFFRLVFRDGGTQSSLYLGADKELAAEVRRVLQEMQAPLRERRERDKQLALMQAALQEQKLDFDRQLRRLGLFLKGNEIRGWRSLPRTPLPAGRDGKPEADHEA